MIDRYLWRVEDLSNSVCQVVAETAEEAIRVAAAWTEHEGSDPMPAIKVERVAGVDAVAGEPLTPAQMNAVTAEVELINQATGLAAHYLVSDTSSLHAGAVGRDNFRGDGLRPELQELERALNRIRDLDRERRRA